MKREVNKGWRKSRHDFSYFEYGKHCLLVQWERSQSKSTITRIAGLQKYLEEQEVVGLIEMVPAYHTLAIYFAPDLLHIEDLISLIEHCEPESYNPMIERKSIEIDVSYGGSSGPDLATVAQNLGLSEMEVVTLHSNTDYYVCFIGFLPGFVYLGGLNSRLNLPRRETPRVRIPSGSVAIAAGQTGIYPIDSPGGWHIIGHTDFPLFNPLVETPCPLSPGMTLRFNPIP